jgi:hypothetical protein
MMQGNFTMKRTLNYTFKGKGNLGEQKKMCGSNLVIKPEAATF